MADQWIEVVGWERFQHYKDRRPPWIKLYPALMRKDEYLALTDRRKLLLLEIWMAYADSGGDLTTTSTQLRHNLTVTYVQPRDLEALSDAGFIRLAASRPLAGCKHDATPETETEEENYIRSSLPTVVTGAADRPALEGAADRSRSGPSKNRRCEICGVTIPPNTTLEEHRERNHQPSETGPQPLPDSVRAWLDGKRPSPTPHAGEDLADF